VACPRFQAGVGAAVKTDGVPIKLSRFAVIACKKPHVIHPAQAQNIR